MKSDVVKSKMDKIRAHFNATGGSSDNRWFNIKAPSRGEDAKATIRVLPAWSKRANEFFYYTVAQHFGFSIGGRNRAIDCPESVDGKGKCPICLFIGKLKNSGDSDHDKLALRLRANRRYFVNIIDRDNMDDGIRIYGTNKKFIEAVLDASDDPDVGDITDPKSGRDIIITRRGQGLKTRYSYRVRTKSTPVTYDRKEMHQLDRDVSQWMTYEDIVKVLKDNFSTELEEVGLKFKKSVKTKPIDDEDEKPVKKGKKVKRVIEEEEDEDIEDEDMNDNEEENEDTPDMDEDDNDDMDDDDEEE